MGFRYGLIRTLALPVSDLFLSVCHCLFFTPLLVEKWLLVTMQVPASLFITKNMVTRGGQGEDEREGEPLT